MENKAIEELIKKREDMLWWIWPIWSSWDYIEDFIADLKTLQPSKPESECHHKFENKSFIEKCLICWEEFKRDYISQWYRENPPKNPDSGWAGIEKLELDLIHLWWHDVHKYKKIEKMPNGRLEEIDDLKICLLGMEEQFNKNFKKIADRINKQ